MTPPLPKEPPRFRIALKILLICGAVALLAEILALLIQPDSDAHSSFPGVYALAGFLVYAAVIAAAHLWRRVVSRSPNHYKDEPEDQDHIDVIP